jgi:hypothetical protein
MRQNSGAKTPREQNYWNKIIAILFSKVQLFAGQTGAGFKTSLFCTHTLGVTAKSRSNAVTARSPPVAVIYTSALQRVNIQGGFR